MSTDLIYAGTCSVGGCHEEAYWPWRECPLHYRAIPRHTAASVIAEVLRDEVGRS